MKSKKLKLDRAISTTLTLLSTAGLAACNGGTVSGNALNQLIGSAPPEVAVNQIAIEDAPSTTTASFSPSAGVKAAMPGAITVSFSHAINVATVTNASMLLSCTGVGRYNVSSVTFGPGLTATGAIATVTPATNAEVCTLSLSATVKDTRGATLYGTTSVAYTIDSLAPTAEVTPAHGFVSSIPTSIAATFSEDMAEAGVIDATHWQISCSGSSAFTVSSVSLAGRVATISLTQTAASSEGDRCELQAASAQIKDLVGNGLSFTAPAYTVSAASPTVTYSPGPSALNAIPSQITANFSEPMDLASVQDVANWSFACDNGQNFSISAVTASGSAADIHITAVSSGGPLTGRVSLPVEPNCTLSASASVRDLAGNGLTGSLSAAYRIDSTNPELNYSNNYSTVTALPSSVTATFNEDMNSSQVTNVANWKLLCDVSGAASSISSITLNGRVATLVLSQNTPTADTDRCVLTPVADGGHVISDLAGNPLSNWEYVATIDRAAALITQASPASGSRLGTSLPGSVVVSFSKTMNTFTVADQANWSVSCAAPEGQTATGAYSISGIVASDSEATLSLTESSVPTYEETCVITGSASIVDHLGNALGASANTVTYVIDKTGPTIAATTPSAGATNVPLATTLSITFSEDMDASTLNTANIYLTYPGTEMLIEMVPSMAFMIATPISISYDGETRKATLSPSSGLTNDRDYVIYARTAILDSHGNAMAVASSTQFRTEAINCADPIINVSNPICPGYVPPAVNCADPITAMFNPSCGGGMTCANPMYAMSNPALCGMPGGVPGGMSGGTPGGA